MSDYTNGQSNNVGDCCKVRTAGWPWKLARGLIFDSLRYNARGLTAVTTLVKPKIAVDRLAVVWPTILWSWFRRFCSLLIGYSVEKWFTSISRSTGMFARGVKKKKQKYTWFLARMRIPSREIQCFPVNSRFQLFPWKLPFCFQFKEKGVI